VLNAHRVTSMADTDIDAVWRIVVLLYCSFVTRIVVMCIGYIILTCDMYKSSLRHIHDPVFSSLKIKGVRLMGKLLNTKCVFDARKSVHHHTIQIN
jgi:hypothetical protein